MYIYFQQREDIRKSCILLWTLWRSMMSLREQLNNVASSYILCYVPLIQALINSLHIMFAIYPWCRLINSLHICLLSTPDAVIDELTAHYACYLPLIQSLMNSVHIIYICYLPLILSLINSLHIIFTIYPWYSHWWTHCTLYLLSTPDTVIDELTAHYVCDLFLAGTVNDKLLHTVSVLSTPDAVIDKLIAHYICNLLLVQLSHW